MIQGSHEVIMNIELYPHQQREIDLSKRMDSRGLFWEMGTGKTGGTISILRNRYNTDRRLAPTLIFSPIITLYNWRDEFQVFSKIDKSHIKVIDKNGKARVKQLQQAMDHASIIIMNWEAVQNDTVFNMLLEWKPEIVVGDELHLIKSHKAKRAKRAVEIADRAKYRYGLTGTPILNSVEDIFMQYRFLDGGRLFGRSFWTFKDKYMYDANAAWKGKQNYFPDMKPRPEMFKELNEKMYKISSRVLKKDCIKDLPPLVKTKRLIPMTAEQTKAYKEMQSHLITFVEKEHDEGKPQAATASIAATKALRLMQIASGFIKTEEGDEIEFKKNPKLEVTEELLKELTPNHKVILWCSFKNNYKQLGKLCEKLKVPHVFITGDMSMPEKQKAVDSFRNDKECRVVVANRKAAGIGINLVEADYSIIFSRNFSLGEEKQSEARNHRGGSQIHDKITQISLLTPGIEELVVQALDNKQNISDIVVDWIKKGL